MTLEQLLHSVDPQQRSGVKLIMGELDTHELHERHLESVLAAATSLQQLASVRHPGETLISVFTPTASEHGWSSRRTIVNICTDDAPFLVGSVSAAIARAGLTVHLLLHPIVPAARDETGTLTSVEANTGITESWMHLEIDRVTSPEDLSSLESRLHEVITDVHLAVADWDAMRNICIETASTLNGTAADFLIWLTHDNFTFLGYQYRSVGEPTPVETGLGVLSSPDREHARLSPRFSDAEAGHESPLSISKAHVRATVQRDVYLDDIRVRTFDQSGTVTGEHQFLGMFSSRAYAASVMGLPIVGDRARAVIEASGFSENSHSGKHLLQVLEEYPRDELFQDNTDHLLQVALEVTKLRSRRRARIFLRPDTATGFISALVFLPRDRYNTTVRHRIESLLREVFEADEVTHTARVGESPLAQLHFLVRLASGKAIPQVSDERMQTLLIDAIRSWDEALVDAVHQHYGDEDSSLILERYAGAFPEAYKEDVTAEEALTDIALLEQLTNDRDFAVHLFPPEHDEPEKRVLTVASGQSYALTRILPVLTDLGVDVVDERPYTVLVADGRTLHISDFGLTAPGVGEQAAARWADSDWGSAFEEVFEGVWRGEVESDQLNALVLLANLSARTIVILRTVSMYVRQISSAFSLDYIEGALIANPVIATGLTNLFGTRFDPDTPANPAQRDREAQHLTEKLHELLNAVESLDHDRILRLMLGVINAVWRTNFYQSFTSNASQPAVALKLDCSRIPGLPKPHPLAEIWVYSPAVEGVHMRFGKVARGGLRWSDRKEDFRTEVLGLVKAQAVKNAVIVPAGSKGGYVAKQLPSPAIDRAAWLAVGKEAYRSFIRAMLDVTDNRDGDQVLPPDSVVRYDTNDPYLVVAADKGTAGFSDIANDISQEYGFWLDDAFASGGSAGYDHKGMGITARGAWESVQRHFREMGHNTQTEDFTVVGVGDMSGDVFGNGMLRSPHIRLVAAFDHRHVFVDPAPDAAGTFTERERLFHLPGSSWDDFDRSLISTGGGVFPLTAKSIEVSPEMVRVLGLAESTTSLTPNELKKAVLQAPVDLLWNGAIGTYIKATDESHADIGDRGNDAVRVNGKELRVKVVGEGGNLGASQRGRIEAAQSGVRINTDAIDNSAGVGASDREVNIKILLSLVESAGSLSRKERDDLLYSMTDEVAHQVLRDNYEQNVLLGNSRANAHEMLPSHERLIGWLEARGDLERDLEALPSRDEVEQRIEQGVGLTRPEFAVLVAYSKLALKEELNQTDLTDDPWFEHTLSDYFPAPMRERYKEALTHHPLKREIIINSVVNSMVNRGGITFAYRASDETGASNEQIARAYVVAREVFDLEGFVAAVEKTDNTVSTQTQTDLYLSFRRLLDRATRWFVQHRGEVFDIGAEIEAFQGNVNHLTGDLESLLQGEDFTHFSARVQELAEAGVPMELAKRGAGLVPSLLLLDVIEQTPAEADVHHFATHLFALSPRVRFNELLNSVTALPQDDRWGAMARASMRDDLYSVMTGLTASVLRNSDESANVTERIDSWFASRDLSALRSFEDTLDALSSGEAGVAAVSVALRRLRSLV